jgi:hypothetical protein
MFLCESIGHILFLFFLSNLFVCVCCIMSPLKCNSVHISLCTFYYVFFYFCLPNLTFSCSRYFYTMCVSLLFLSLYRLSCKLLVNSFLFCCFSFYTCLYILSISLFLFSYIIFFSIQDILFQFLSLPSVPGMSG